MWPVIAGGITMGLLSSFHCIGMCGPLALALPLQHKPAWARLLSMVLYHGGRLLTYSLLGLAFGIAGRRLQVAGWQQWFSILLGSFIILVWALSYIGKSTTRIPLLHQLQQRITQLNMFLWRAPEKHGFLLLGMANGLLPCGMVYMAIAAAISTGAIGYSTMFMAAFGVGTLPALAGLGYFSMMINMTVRNSLKKLTPYVMVTMGILLVLRGLDLNIPFISPVLPVVQGNNVSCH